LHEKLVKENSTMPRTLKQEDLLATARKGQEIMVDAIRTWVETVRTANPRLSSVYAPFAERLPKVSSVYAPFAGQLPKAEAAVASAYDLAERMLASQRKFAEDIVKATRPLMPGFGESQPENHGEPAAQETAAEQAPQETAAEQPPQAPTVEKAPQAPTAAKSSTKTTAKTTATARAPKSTPTSRAPKGAATKRAPRNPNAG
jgi:hypothetical protein